MKRGETLEKLWSRTVKTEDECWLWQGCTNSKGYPYTRYQGKMVGAHRLVYQLTGHTLYPSEPVHHTCGHSTCINPGHLQRATNAENSLEMMARTSLERRISELEDALRAVATQITAVLDGVSNAK